MEDALFITHLQSFACLTVAETNSVDWSSLLDKPTIVLIFQDDRLENTQKRPFLDTKLAVGRARQHETARNLFVVMPLCSPVVLSYLDAGFEPRCGRKDFLLACCC